MSYLWKFRRTNPLKFDMKGKIMNTHIDNGTNKGVNGKGRKVKGGQLAVVAGAAAEAVAVAGAPQAAAAPTSATGIPAATQEAAGSTPAATQGPATAQGTPTTAPASGTQANGATPGAAPAVGGFSDRDDPLDDEVDAMWAAFAAGQNLDAPATAKPSTAAAVKAEPTKATHVHQWLSDILSRRRCHGSKGDTDFRAWLTAIITNMGLKPVLMSENIVVTTDTASTVMFSSHVDTVHSHTESNGQRQALLYDQSMAHIFLDRAPTNHGGCLGADDGAGVYVMLRMLEKRVPGTFVFHVGEERGGIGANAMMKDHPKFIAKFTHAIAFDRAGNQDVVITQGGRSCASVQCGTALAAALGKVDPSLKYSNSHGGTFTDVRVYAEVIPECINLAVGYMNQHGVSETLDVDHLEKLAAASCLVDWAGLPRVRQPGPTMDNHHSSQNKGSGAYGGYGGNNYGNRNYTSGAGYSTPKTQAKQKKAQPSLLPYKEVEGGIEELFEMSRAEIMDYVESNPNDAARDLMTLLGRYKALSAQVTVLEQYLG